MSRPCRLSISSPLVDVGALDHLPDRGVLARDLLALLIAEGVHVQQQRLLDLGVVEQVAEALGRQLGMLGQHDRRAQHGAIPSPSSTGKVLTGSLADTASPSAPSRSSGETKVPPYHLEQRVGGDQAVAERLRRAWRRGVARNLGLVVDAEPDPCQVGASSSARIPPGLGGERRPRCRTRTLATRLAASSASVAGPSSIARSTASCALAGRLEEKHGAGELRLGSAPQHRLEPQHRERRRLASA